MLAGPRAIKSISEAVISKERTVKEIRPMEDMMEPMRLKDK